MPQRSFTYSFLQHLLHQVISQRQVLNVFILLCIHDIPRVSICSIRCSAVPGSWVEAHHGGGGGVGLAHASTLSKLWAILYVRIGRFARDLKVGQNPRAMGWGPPGGGGGPFWHRIGSPMESDQHNYSADSKTDMLDIYGLLYKSGPEPLSCILLFDMVMFASLCICMSPIHLYGTVVENFNQLIWNRWARFAQNFIWSLRRLGEWKISEMVAAGWPRWPSCPYIVKNI